MDYPHQLDIAWLAVDDHQALAVMISAGEGPIPDAVLAHDADQIFGLEKALLSLPPIGAALDLAKVPDASSFAALSERGLFVYDWSDVHRTRVSALNGYELVARPSLAIDLDGLPQALRRLAARVGGAFGAPLVTLA